MARKMSGTPGKPLIMLASAAFFVGSLSGCGSIFGEEADTGVQCVKKVDPNAPDDDVEVEVVDPRLCDEDGTYYNQYGGGGFFFISTGGNYYGSPLGGRYIHSTSDGGSPLINRTDTAARNTAGVGKSFTSNTTIGKTTVKSGGLGFGGGGKAGGSSGSSGG